METQTRVLPMFPLGRTLFPGEQLPLRVFEPRYVVMMREVLAGSREFGVVLIERGWEVGGGDERTDVGTVAAVVDAAVLGEGQYAIVGLGTSRFRVAGWLDDDPFPRASVVEHPDTDDSLDGDRLESLERRIGTVYALASELGADVAGRDLAVPDVLVDALWRLCSLAPVGELDRQRLLQTASAPMRAKLLDSLVTDLIEELRLRLGEERG